MNTSDLPVNAFEYFRLTPQSPRNELLIRVAEKIRKHPEKMSEIAEYQKKLLEPGQRFLIEFLYYLEVNPNQNERT
jgi:hypothetical protein